MVRWNVICVQLARDWESNTSTLHMYDHIMFMQVLQGNNRIKEMEIASGKFDSRRENTLITSWTHKHDHQTILTLNSAYTQNKFNHS